MSVYLKSLPNIDEGVYMYGQQVAASNHGGGLVAFTDGDSPNVLFLAKTSSNFAFEYKMFISATDGIIINIHDRERLAKVIKSVANGCKRRNIKVEFDGDQMILPPFNGITPEEMDYIQDTYDVKELNFVAGYNRHAGAHIPWDDLKMSTMFIVCDATVPIENYTRTVNAIKYLKSTGLYDEAESTWESVFKKSLSDNYSVTETYDSGYSYEYRPVETSTVSSVSTFDHGKYNIDDSIVDAMKIKGSTLEVSLVCRTEVVLGLIIGGALKRNGVKNAN